MYTNHPNFGGSLETLVSTELKNSSQVDIASGYVSFETVKTLEPSFYPIAKRGLFRLLVGMAFYEGLSSGALSLLRQIDQKLTLVNQESGVFVCYSRRFHGKVYRFQNGGTSKILVGSANFSPSGLAGNFECSVPVFEEATRKNIEKYLDFIFSSANAVSINKANVPVTNTAKFRSAMYSGSIPGVRTYDPKTVAKSKLPFFDFDLSRVVTDKQSKSNLNAYFGKGRLNSTTGVITPRPWYEVELISSKDDISVNPLYPKGDFTAYTDDGFIIPMRTQGDYYKNMRSRGGLQILGMWIKGKLQRSGALIPLTPIDNDVLVRYGSERIRFYKMDTDKYFLEFS